MNGSDSALNGRKIRVLRVITWLPVGGIERRLVEILPRIDRNRFEVSIVCIRERGPLADTIEASGIPVHCIPFRSRWDLRALRQLANLMRERQIDIVHSHMYRSNVPATVAARMAGIRHVWCQVHNVDTWETRRQAWMDRFVSRWREGMIAVSECVKKDINKKLRIPPERIRVIYNGIDLERFQSAGPSRAALCLEEKIGDQQVVFLFAARLVEQKRCTDFLEAFRRIQLDASGDEHVSGNIGRIPPVRAWILGDGPLLPVLRSQVDQLPDPAAVRFLGKKDDVEKYMAAADILVLPSTREGFSNAIIEAMASGLPVIASDVGGNAEAVQDKKEGLIIQPLQVGRLADAMRRLLQDPGLRLAMSRAAREKAGRFSLDAMVRDTEELYDSCIDRKGHALS